MLVFMGDGGWIIFSYRSHVDTGSRLDNAPDSIRIKSGSPITLPGIILRQFCLLLAGNGFVGIDVRAMADLFLRNSDRENSVFPGMADHSLRSNQDFPGQPVSCLYDQVSDGPDIIVEIEILHLSDVAIPGCYSKTDQVFNIA
jgi:hypothetical protein